MLWRFLDGFMGELIPLFYSYKAIKRGTKVSLTIWLKYWVVFAIFQVFTFFLELFFLSSLIPFYGTLKTMFIIWCVNPYTAGAQFMYDKVLRTMICRYEKKVGKQATSILSSIMECTPSLLSEIFDFLISATISLKEPSPPYRGWENGSDYESDHDESENVQHRKVSGAISTSHLFDPRFVKPEPVEERYVYDDEVVYDNRQATDSSGEDIYLPRKDTFADETTSEDDVEGPAVLRRSQRFVQPELERLEPRQRARLRSQGN